MYGSKKLNRKADGKPQAELIWIEANFPMQQLVDILKRALSNCYMKFYI